MNVSEIEENLISIGEPKLHSEMCKSLCFVYVKVLTIFPNLEAARPRSTSGIQALCALHIALEKTKNVLQHCAECSKLYLAITGDSVILKFEKARCALEDSLHRVEDIVPQAIGGKIAEILIELGGIEFSLDPVEKQTGDEIIGLLQQRKNFKSSCSDNNELESFHKAAGKLGITSSRAALRERRALKKLIERAQAKEDKRKELIITYLQHLMKKYSKVFRSEFSDENDSQGSTPCSPSIRSSLDDGIVICRNSCTFHRQFSKLSSFNFKPYTRLSDQLPVPPEELRCPISLQLMYDPVIIASGQTYERLCIEKWFSDGHSTCPKTQQQLPHLCLTPNYCVKGLVASWCEQNTIPVPAGPPESLDLNYWRLVLSECDSTHSKSLESMSSYKFKSSKDVPFIDCGIIKEAKANEEKDFSAQGDNCELDHDFSKYDSFLRILRTENDTMNKCKTVEKIRNLLKDDEEARIYMGANGFIEELLNFLESAVSSRNRTVQEIVAMSLFNLAVNNNRNKELMLASGVLPILQDMIADTHNFAAATALYLSLSTLGDAQAILGSSEAVPFLINVLNIETDEQCKLDALHTLYNISGHPSNVHRLLSAGIIGCLLHRMTHPADHAWTEKCIAIIIHLASTTSARDEIVAAPGLISALTTVLDIGEPVEQEQAAACLLLLCNANETCIQMVLQEGVIPALVSISVNGTVRGKQKAQKLLLLFREQRQRDPPPGPAQPGSENTEAGLSSHEQMEVQSKSVLRRKLSKSWTFWKKSKSFAMYQC